MRREQLRFDDDFRVAAGNARSQVATMGLAAGESTGGGPLQTLNVYVPAAYDESGEPLPGRGE